MTPPNLSSGRDESRPSCLTPGRHLIGLHLCCTTTCLLLYLLGIDAICSSTYRVFTASLVSRDFFSTGQGADRVH